MKVGLFIPCYIDQFYPEVGKASYQLLKKLNVDVEYPLGQTCCGQPLANGGFESMTKKSCGRFVSLFEKYDAIVTPSGSCAYHVKEHYDLLPQTKNVSHVRENIYELCEFIVHQLGITKLDASFPFKVGLHQSCHGLRGLQLGTCSEESKKETSVMKTLLNEVKGIELISLDRKDECCGFGGTFAVKEEAVSVKMGYDRILDHFKNKAAVITGTDTSCLMHMEGIIKRKNLNIKTMHIAEILNANL